MKVKATKKPETDLINESLDRIDFTDTFSTTNKEDDIEKISRLIFETTPGWIAFLFRVRNVFAKLIGLKTDAPEATEKMFEPEGQLSFFEIYAVTKNEVIMGRDDSHLKFRVSILKDTSQDFNVKVTTLVMYLNRTGKIYMNIIKPFHRLAVRAMVKNAYKKN